MRTITKYKSYSFTDKDPIIDKLNTAYRDAMNNDPTLRAGGFAEVQRRSGLSVTTPRNWFDGDTKRPQFATIAAFARAIGYDVVIAKVSPTTNKVTQLIPIMQRLKRAANDAA